MDAKSLARFLGFDELPTFPEREMVPLLGTACDEGGPAPADALDVARALADMSASLRAAFTRAPESGQPDAAFDFDPEIATAENVPSLPPPLSPRRIG
jgi:hypothetical protein